MRHDKISLRPTVADLRHLDAIADRIRATTGHSFITRTSAIRAALAHAAAQSAGVVPEATTVKDMADG